LIGKKVAPDTAALDATATSVALGAVGASNTGAFAGYGLKQGDNEPCVFRDPVTGFTVVLYVDDILTRGSLKQTKEFHRVLGLRFDCKPEEYLAPNNELDFIGFTISEEVQDGKRCLHLDQQQALDQLLDSFDRSLLQPKDSPMPSKHLMH
jgi:hypothetical protein